MQGGQLNFHNGGILEQGGGNYAISCSQGYMNVYNMAYTRNNGKFHTYNCEVFIDDCESFDICLEFIN